MMTKAVWGSTKSLINISMGVDQVEDGSLHCMEYIETDEMSRYTK